jgi:hypothetical protein
MANVAPARQAQESVSLMSRITKDGRKITYQLTVVQQPERARACGSGARCELPCFPFFH